MSKTNEECNIELINAFKYDIFNTDEEFDIFNTDEEFDMFIKDLKTNNHLFTHITNISGYMLGIAYLYTNIILKHFPETLYLENAKYFNVKEMKLENISIDITTKFFFNILTDTGYENRVHVIKKCIEENINYINIEDICDMLITYPYFMCKEYIPILDTFINRKINMYKYAENITNNIRYMRYLHTKSCSEKYCFKHLYEYLDKEQINSSDIEMTQEEANNYCIYKSLPVSRKYISKDVIDLNPILIKYVNSYKKTCTYKKFIQLFAKKNKNYIVNGLYVRGGWKNRENCIGHAFMCYKIDNYVSYIIDKYK